MARIKSNPAIQTNRSSSAQKIDMTPVSEQNYIARASNLDNDEAKYQAAVDIARIKLQDKDTVSDEEFKNTIDSYYSQFDPEKSGREMRGENAWTDFVGGAKDATDSFMTGIGNALDFGFDNIVGGGLDLIGAKDTAQRARDLFTGEDLAIIPDIATDVALTATGIGIPLMVAKNAVQLSPQMSQGISGKDAITLEQMDLDQQLANAALGFGGVGLSLIPGVGKLKNIAKATEKKNFEKAIGSAVDKAVEAANKGKTIPKATEIPKASDSLFADEGVQKALDLVENANKMSRAERVGHVLSEDIKGLGSGITSLPEALSETRKAQKNALDARKLAKKANQVAKDSIDNKTPRDIFEELLNGKAAERGITAKELAEELGVKDVGKLYTKPTTAIDRSKARAAVREAVESSDTKLTKAEKDTIFENALQEIRDTKKLRPSAFKGRGPIKSMQTYSQSALNNLLQNANAGAPNLIRSDLDAILQSLQKQEKLQAKTGPKGVASRIANSASNPAKSMGSRAVATVTPIASAFLGEKAANGGSFEDAVRNIGQNPMRLLPMMLTGSKGISRQINPGLRGYVGNSDIPHLAMRNVAAAERMANQDESTENEGFQQALNKLVKQRSA